MLAALPIALLGVVLISGVSSTERTGGRRGEARFSAWARASPTSAFCCCCGAVGRICAARRSAVRRHLRRRGVREHRRGDHRRRPLRATPPRRWWLITLALTSQVVGWLLIRSRFHGCPRRSPRCCFASSRSGRRARRDHPQRGADRTATRWRRDGARRAAGGDAT